MKVAVLLSGFLRKLDWNIDSLINNILYNVDYDFFISSYYPYLTNHNYIDYLNTETINYDIINKLNCKKLEIEDYSLYEKYFNEKCIEYNFDQTNRVFSQFYKVYKCNMLRLDYQKENNINYDFIIRTRSDIFFNKKIDITTFDNNFMHINEFCGHNETSLSETNSRFGTYKIVDDKFSISNCSNMTIYCDTYTNLDKYIKTDSIIHQEGLLAKQLLTNNIKIKLYDFNIKLNR